MSGCARISVGIVHVLRLARISDKLVQEALARGYNGAFVPQPGQGNGNFLLVTAADAICHDVYFVAVAEQIERGLCYADMALDTDNDAGQRAGGIERVEGLLDLGGTMTVSVGSAVRASRHAS